MPLRLFVYNTKGESLDQMYAVSIAKKYDVSKKAIYESLKHFTAVRGKYYFAYECSFQKFTEQKREFEQSKNEYRPRKPEKTQIKPIHNSFFEKTQYFENEELYSCRFVNYNGLYTYEEVKNELYQHIENEPEKPALHEIER